MPPARKKRRISGAALASVQRRKSLTTSSTALEDDEVDGAEEEEDEDEEGAGRGSEQEEEDVRVVNGARRGKAGSGSVEATRANGHAEAATEEGDEEEEEQEEEQTPEPEETPEMKKERETRERIWMEFAEEYYDIVEQLPLEINRNFTLIEEFEGSMQESVQRLHENLRSYIKLVNPFALRSVAADPPAVVPEAGPLADAVTSTTAAQEDDLLASDGGAAPPSAPETAVNGDADAPQTSTDVPEVVMADASPRQTGAEGGGTVEQGGTSLASGPGVATEPSAVSEDDEAVVAAQLLALSGSAPTDAAGATAAAPTVNGVDGSEAMVEAAAGTNGEAGPLNATTATTTEANPFLNGLLEVDQGVELSAEEKEARRRKTMLQIAEHMNRSIKLAQDKVNLATTVYDWVDRHINRLDADLLKYEDAAVLGLRDGTLPSADAPSAAHLAADTASARKTSIRLTGAFANAQGGNDKQRKGHRTTRGRDKQKAQEAEDAEVVAATRRGGSQDKGSGSRKGSPDKHATFEVPPQGKKGKRPPGGRSAPPVDTMAIDPNEPRYCYCNSVSYGTMVGCDNLECEKEWFHLGCVGLTSEPKGKWYCRDCAPKMSKKR